MEVMRWTPDCSRCECFLFVRPFVRLLGPKEEWAIDHLRSMRGTVEIDGQVIAEDVPIDSWIVNLDGHGLTVLPYKFIPRQYAFLWGHEHNMEARNSEPPVWVPGADTYPDTGAPLGPILTDETELVIQLSRSTNPALRIVVGCVMGLYSTVPR